jgi:hypothetical protein
MLVRPLSGALSVSNCLRPITTGLPMVVRLKYAMSDGIDHGIAPARPMTPFSATAAIIAIIALIDRPAPGARHR